jgi:hypothetical protein
MFCVTEQVNREVHSIAVGRSSDGHLRRLFDQSATLDLRSLNIFHPCVEGPLLDRLKSFLAHFDFRRIVNMTNCA